MRFFPRIFFTKYTKKKKKNSEMIEAVYIVLKTPHGDEPQT